MNDNYANEKRRMYTNYSAVLGELKRKGRIEDYAAVADILKGIEHHLFSKYPEPKVSTRRAANR